jgi:hypothetical protein
VTLTAPFASSAHAATFAIAAGDDLGLTSGIGPSIQTSPRRLSGGCIIGLLGRDAW